MGTDLTIAYYIRMLSKEYEDRPAINFKSVFRTVTFSYSQIHDRLFSRMMSAARHLPHSVRRLLFHKVHQKLGGRLEMFITGGSALDPDMEDWWAWLGFAIFQGYGLTEASPIATLNTPFHRRHGSVGRSLPHQEINLAPDNEIWMRGDNVAPGYIVDYRYWLRQRFGRVRVTFGEPIHADELADPGELASEFENAVRRLQ